MNLKEKLVLPFRWSEFGSWYTKFQGVGSENTAGSMRISDLSFAAGKHSLDGIKIAVELFFEQNLPKEVFLCGFIADLKHKQLFEPFIGNPDTSESPFHASCIINPRQGRNEVVELFIPEAGWVLPSIWRFLTESLGLRPKGHEHMPDIFVCAMVPGSEKPLLTAAKSFDYYGSAERLKQEMLLEEFYRQLNLDAKAGESDVQRAYIKYCRDLQTALVNGFTVEAIRQKRGCFNRVKQGYQLWAEKLQQFREDS